MAKKEIDLEQTFRNIFNNIKYDIDELYELVTGLTNTVQALSLARGKRGIFVRVGLIAFYVLGEYVIDNVEPNSYITLDEIPYGFFPAVTMSQILVVGNVAQLTNSLLIRFNRVSGTIEVVNLANNRIKNTLCLTSPYNYIVSSSAFDATAETEPVDPATVNWNDIQDSNVEPSTQQPVWSSTDDNG